MKKDKKDKKEKKVKKDKKDKKHKKEKRERRSIESHNSDKYLSLVVDAKIGVNKINMPPQDVPSMVAPSSNILVAAY